MIDAARATDQFGQSARKFSWTHPDPPIFTSICRSFATSPTSRMKPAFAPMPRTDWVVGVADVRQSTEAIRQNRYRPSTWRAPR